LETLKVFIKSFKRKYVENKFLDKKKLNTNFRKPRLRLDSGKPNDISSTYLLKKINWDRWPGYMPKLCLKDPRTLTAYVKPPYLVFFFSFFIFYTIFFSYMVFKFFIFLHYICLKNNNFSWWFVGHFDIKKRI
jgi:hypothetical protein